MSYNNYFSQIVIPTYIVIELYFDQANCSDRLYNWFHIYVLGCCNNFDFDRMFQNMILWF